MASIGTLTGFLTLNDSQYKAALEKNTQRTNSFARGVASTFGQFLAPAALTGGMIAFGKVAIEQASKIKDSAEQAGLSIEQWQALDYVFRQNGSSGDQLTAVLTKLRGSIADAANGSKSAREAFARIGLHFSELVNMSPADQLKLVADAMRKAGSGTLEYSAAADILGSKNLPRLNAGLKQFSETGMPAAIKQAKEFGQVVDERYVKNVEQFGQALKNAGTEAKNASVTGFGALLEILKNPNFEKAFAGAQFVPNGRDPNRGQLEQRARERELLKRAATEDAQAAKDAIAAAEKAAIALSIAKMKKAPGAGRSGAIKKDTLKQAEVKAVEDAAKLEQAKAERALEIFKEGLKFSETHDPIVAYAENIREANKALESGVVTAVAYKTALQDAAKAFGASKIDKIQEQIGLVGLSGQSRQASTMNRALDRARRSAANGNLGDAQSQIDYINSQNPALGMTLEEATGRAALPDAKNLAGNIDSKSKTLEGEVAKLVTAIDAIAKKLTVS